MLWDIHGLTIVCRRLNQRQVEVEVEGGAEVGDEEEDLMGVLVHASMVLRKQ